MDHQIKWESGIYLGRGPSRSESKSILAKSNLYSRKYKYTRAQQSLFLGVFNFWLFGENYLQKHKKEIIKC